MFTTMRSRSLAGLLVVALTAVFMVGQPRPVRAAPTYSPGVIAFGTGYTSGWTVVDPRTHKQHTVTPSGAGYDAAKLQVWTLRYSPDGQRVAFIAIGYVPTYSQDLWVASADGTGARRLAENEAGRPAWTADGTRILLGGPGGGVRAVPADGSGPPALFVPDDCGALNPQTTDRGYVFYTRTCPPANRMSLAVHRPGDTTSATVSDDPLFGDANDVVSPDGSRVARWISDGADTFVTVNEVGSVDLGQRVASFDGELGLVDFGSYGDLAVAYESAGYHFIQTVALSPNATPRTVVIEPMDAAYAIIRFLDWVNGPSDLSARPTADRVGGADRVATAIDASRWAFDTRGDGGRQAATAVLSRADLYPDALAGTALAIQMGGPLLLTPGTALDPGVGAELQRLLPLGSTVYLLGGSNALSPAIADAVQHLGFKPLRLGGRDRYATAVAIATAIAGTRPKSVLLATGTDFPDALTAGTAAGQERYSLRGTSSYGGGVVLLTDGKNMPEATLGYLNGLVPEKVSLYEVGGPAAAAVHSALPRWPNPIPLVGSDRFETAAKVATSALFGNGAVGRYTMAGIATGLNFPDAMSGGALTGSLGAPLLLADGSGLTPAETAILADSHLGDVAVIGGPAVVSDGVLTAAADAAFGAQTWDAFTNRPAPPLP